ncbi:FAD-dependent oxidoreductase [bacterium CPR1]|nr:FAD-dependent oxidoreductase [bacterium CPR1]
MSSAGEYDLVVLGGGAAGLVCAVTAALAGARVALVEREKLGGDCTNYGCIPSKALLHAARLAHLARTSSQAGVLIAPPEVDFPAVLAGVRRAIATVASHEEPSELQAAGCEVLFGQGVFGSQSSLTVADRVLGFRRAVIATGTVPAVPDIPGLQARGFVTNREIFSLAALPAHLLVLGGGPIGCELAQAFARLGSRVTLVQRNRRLLPLEEEEASSLLERQFRNEGIEVLTSSRLTRAEPIQIETPSGPVMRPCDQILVATGRLPATEGLGLEVAGVEQTTQGYVRVDHRLRTTNPRIWACGDIHGGLKFTHVAEYEAKLVVAQALFRLPLRPSYRVIPWTTFTDPEVARVGLSEAGAREAGLDPRVWRFPVARVDRAITEGETVGFYKLVTDRRGRILGATIVAQAAGELIHEAALAMQHGIKADALARTVHVYPTRALGLRRAADLYLLESIPAWLRRLVQWLLGYRTDRRPTPLITGEMESDHARQVDP